MAELIAPDFVSRWMAVAAPNPSSPSAGRLSDRDGGNVFVSDYELGAGSFAWFAVFTLAAVGACALVAATINTSGPSAAAFFGLDTGRATLHLGLLAGAVPFGALAVFAFVKLLDRRPWLIMGKSGVNLPRHSDFMFTWDDISAAGIETVGGKRYLCLRVVNAERALNRCSPGKAREQARAFNEKAGFAALAIPVRFPLSRSGAESALAMLNLRLNKKSPVASHQEPYGQA